MTHGTHDGCHLWHEMRFCALGNGLAWRVRVYYARDGSLWQHHRHGAIMYLRLITTARPPVYCNIIKLSVSSILRSIIIRVSFSGDPLISLFFFLLFLEQENCCEGVFLRPLPQNVLTHLPIFWTRDHALQKKKKRKSWIPFHPPRRKRSAVLIIPFSFKMDLPSAPRIPYVVLLYGRTMGALYLATFNGLRFDREAPCQKNESFTFLFLFCKKGISQIFHLAEPFWQTLRLGGVFQAGALLLWLPSFVFDLSWAERENSASYYFRAPRSMHMTIQPYIMKGVPPMPRSFQWFNLPWNQVYLLRPKKNGEPTSTKGKISSEECLSTRILEHRQTWWENFLSSVLLFFVAH